MKFKLTNDVQIVNYAISNTPYYTYINNNKKVNFYQPQ